MPVKFSENALEATLATLGESTEDWLAGLDYSRNRVSVAVGVLTPEVEAQLQPYAEQVYVDQLLRALE